MAVTLSPQTGHAPLNGGAAEPGVMGGRASNALAHLSELPLSARVGGYFSGQDRCDEQLISIASHW